jgi:hypothetical protein
MLDQTKLSIDRRWPDLFEALIPVGRQVVTTQIVQFGIGDRMPEESVENDHLV